MYNRVILIVTERQLDFKSTVFVNRNLVSFLTDDHHRSQVSDILYKDLKAISEPKKL
jgi:hypothetical protein